MLFIFVRMLDAQRLNLAEPRAYLARKIAQSLLPSGSLT